MQARGRIRTPTGPRKEGRGRAKSGRGGARSDGRTREGWTDGFGRRSIETRSSGAVINLRLPPVSVSFHGPDGFDRPLRTGGRARRVCSRTTRRGDRHTAPIGPPGSGQSAPAVRAGPSVRTSHPSHYPSQPSEPAIRGTIRVSHPSQPSRSFSRQSESDEEGESAGNPETSFRAELRLLN